MSRKEAYFAKCTALYNPPAVTDAEKNKYFYEKFDINATFGDVSHNKNISNMDLYFNNNRRNVSKSPIK